MTLLAARRSRRCGSYPRWSPSETPFRRQSLLVWILFLAAVEFLAVTGTSLLQRPSVTELAALALNLTFIAVAVTLAGVLLVSNPANIQHPLPWFLLASAAYFGFGPTVYLWGADGTLKLLNAFFPVTDADLVQTALVNYAGVFVAAGTAGALGRHWRTPQPICIPQVKATTLAFLLVAVGLTARYALVLPNEWAASADGGQSLGMWVQLASLSKAGLAATAFVASERRGSWLLVLCGVALLDGGWALLAANKLELLLSIVSVGFGFCLQRRNLRPLVVTLIGSIALYLLVATATLVLREELRASATASFSSRLSILWNVVQGRDQSAGREYYQSQGVQIWWMRLSYANAQSFAMRQYESGNPGDSIVAGLVTPVPRVLWPNKPAVDAYGTTFHESITGMRASAASPGIFVESYWNGGWPFVFAIAAILGVVFHAFGSYAQRRLSSGALIALPVALSIIRCALRPDAWFSLEVTAPVVVCAMFVGLERLLVVGFGTQTRYTPRSLGRDPGNAQPWRLARRPPHSPGEAARPRP
jgi:hypothetical protein